MTTTAAAKPAPIVRAIDVGYGNTKYVAFHKPGSPIQCSIFPSITPQASGGEDLNGGIFQRRNTVKIEINGVAYEVGKDARLAQDASYGRALTADYSLSDPYMALVRAAVFYMGVSKIDMLVVGLPVNTFQTHAAELAKRLKRVHKIPANINGQPSATEIVEVPVLDVRVLPQPIGAFFDYSISNNLYGRMKSQMNLVIDPGFFTLDWVVSQGVKTVNARSGAHSGGMSAVLSAMAEAIGRDLGVQLNDASSIDHALRTGTKPTFFGKDLDLAKYMPVGKEKARQFVGVLATKVGNKGVDINNIVLAGGGAEFFKDVIQESFPHHELVIAKEPVYANVRGFQLAGAQFANQEAFSAQRPAGR